MEVVTILVLLVLNIALPTLDAVTDIILVIKLYRGAHYCMCLRPYCERPYQCKKNEICRIQAYCECKKDPVSYCSNDGNNEICRIQAYCEYHSFDHPERDDYDMCYDDPDGYCSNGGNSEMCRFSTHSKMATAMLTPFLLNYFVCFITFFIKEKNKKFTFIFALLSIYPQFGKNNH